MNNRKIYLAKNTALFALNSIGTKLITFFLVPVYTAALTTSDYGIADLVSTIATILVPILTLNIGEAVMRFSLDENADYNKIMSVGICVAVVSSVVSVLIFPVTLSISLLSKYCVWIFLYCIVQGIYQIVVCYLRGTEQLISFAEANIIHVLSTAVLNIIYLLFLKEGLSGYFKSYIWGYIIGIVFAILKGHIISSFRMFHFEKELAVSMIKYSIVLVPTSFMWWIMNSSNRIMVTSMIGVAANGVYAVSYKIPTVVSTMSTVFNQAWSYSAIKEDKSKDRESFNNLMFDKFVSIQFLITGALLMIIKPFIKLYVSENYWTAWEYTPCLIIGYLFMSLGTFLSTSYTVNKDSKGFLFSGLCGAIMNLLLNWLLIPVFGVNGSAFATCISYVAVFVYRAFDTRKYLRLEIIKRQYLFSLIVIIIMGFTLYVDSIITPYILILEFVLICIIEWQFIIGVLNMVLQIIKK